MVKNCGAWGSSAPPTTVVIMVSSPQDCAPLRRERRARAMAIGSNDEKERQTVGTLP
jgi:hypothetical protein